MSKNRLFFASEAACRAAEAAIAAEGAVIYGENGHAIDGQGRVLATNGKVAIASWSTPWEHVDGRWSIADPSAEDSFGGRVRRGQMSRGEANAANAAMAARVKTQIVGPYDTLPGDAVARVEPT